MSADAAAPVPREFVRGADGYTADPELGKVYGLRGKEITSVDANGYVRINYKGAFRERAHRVIWQMRNGPIPDGMVVNHINGVKTDNRIANLELVTTYQNSMHAIKNGLTNNAGERNGQAVLTEAQVREIRASTDPREVLAERYGVCRTSIHNILSRVSWKGVSP